MNIQGIEAQAIPVRAPYDDALAPFGPFPKALVKFKQCSISEVFGYRLAAVIGLRTPRMVAFWSSSLPKDRDHYGRIGVAIEYMEDWKTVWRGHAPAIDKNQVGKALALCAFDRYEWGEFGLSKGLLYFVDLERILPRINPDYLLEIDSQEVEAELIQSEREFLAQVEAYQDCAREDIFKVAYELEVLQEFLDSLRQLCTITQANARTLFRAETHPLASTLTAFAVCAFGKAQNLYRPSFGLRRRPIKDWH